MKFDLKSGILRFFIALAWNILSWLVYLAVVILLYFGFLRDIQMTWGATNQDVGRRMPGDELIVDPEMNATRAVDIRAAPEEIWPWIVQIGYARAGFYGFDNLDNGGRPSARNILPEFQNLHVGDSIPSGEYRGELFYIMKVAAIDPGKEMLWIFLEGTPWEGATWSWGLYPIDNERTRLVSRLRQKYSFNSFQEIISWSMIDAIEILMMRTTLRGIKLRAESM